MGSSNPQVVVSTPIVLGTAYGVAVTPEFEVTGNDFTTIIVDANAGVSTTGITMKPQVKNLEGTFVDLYQHNGTSFVADEIALPLADSMNNQRRAVRLDTRGISVMRFISKTVGGLGQINSLQAIRDGSSTPTPRSA